VNSVGSDLVLKNGAVSRAFLKAGGQEIQNECSDYIASHGCLSVAGVVLTKPGAIPCKNIIHTVGSTYSAINEEQSKEVSYLLDKYITSIHTTQAIPHNVSTPLTCCP